MKQRVKRLIQINRALIVVSVCVVLYSGFHMIDTYATILDKKAEISNLEYEIMLTEQANEELLEMLEEGATDEAIAYVAREKLDFVMPGERVIVDSSSK